jgi:hypothetical protein
MNFTFVDDASAVFAKHGLEPATPPSLSLPPGGQSRPPATLADGPSKKHYLREERANRIDSENAKILQKLTQIATTGASTAVNARLRSAGAVSSKNVVDNSAPHRGILGQGRSSYTIRREREAARIHTANRKLLDKIVNVRPDPVLDIERVREERARQEELVHMLSRRQLFSQQAQRGGGYVPGSRPSTVTAAPGYFAASQTRGL